MHTVHVPEEPQDGIGYAAVGIFFDVKYYDAELSYTQRKIVDNFFDSLQWNSDANRKHDKYKIDMLNYGTLMDMVDFNNRWTYKGSVTTPPCGQYVHWNVLRTIYPISERHLKQF